MNYEISRERMVAEQILGRGIQNAGVLAAMRKVPRHLFVEEAFAGRAYGDYPLPIGEKQTISQPYMVALMTEALDPGPKDRVLEIGTGSGYQTGILAELCAKVFSIERIKLLAERAERILRCLGYPNLLIKVGDGSNGWKEEAPFEGILVTAGAPSVPMALMQQLTEGGRLIIPIGDEFSQSLTKIVRKGNDYHQSNLTGCVFVKLIGDHGWKD
ncbi:MAG: protein-L-isoaspartate(D-aspartate) O-methyltransferase [bacterium]